MKLYEAPRNSIVRPVEAVNVPPGGKPVGINREIRFHHIDGAYSYCTDYEGDVVHLPAWQEVEVVE